MTANTTPATPNDPNTPSSGTTPIHTDNPVAGGGDSSPSATDQTGREAPKDEWENFDAERAKNTILKQRESEALLKKQLAEERAKLEEYEREKMTDTEKLQADLAAAQKTASEALKHAEELSIRNQFDTGALRAGINPKALTAARALLPKVASSDESGKMIIDEAVFEKLKTEHDYLFSSQGTASKRTDSVLKNATDTGVGNVSPQLTNEQIAFAKRAGMTPEQFVKYSNRVIR